MNSPESFSWIAEFDEKSGIFFFTKKLNHTFKYAFTFLFRKKGHLFRLGSRNQLNDSGLSNRHFIYPFLICALGLVSCAKEEKNPTVAKVGSVKVMQSELEAEIASSPPVYQNYLSTVEGKKQFLDILLKERLLVNAAKGSGILRRKEVQRSLKEYEERAKEQEKQFRKSVILREFLRELQEGKLKVAEGELKGYYEQNKTDFQNPAELSASHILCSSAQDAEAALKRVKKGEDFGKVAQEVSKDPSASRGGFIGKVVRGDLADIPEFEAELFRLKPGQVSEVVQTKIGYHVIKKNGEVKLPSLSFEQAAPQIRRVLEKKKFDQWMESEKAAQKVWVDEKALASVPVPSHQPQQTR